MIGIEHNILISAQPSVKSYSLPYMFLPSYACEVIPGVIRVDY